MLFAQYAKQFTYVECIVANRFASEALQCDCEKKLETDFDEANTTWPLEKNHVHLSLDDAYTYINPFALQTNFSALDQLQNPFYLALMPNGIHLHQDQPPEFHSLIFSDSGVA